MKVCEYKRFSSKDNKPFEEHGTGIFKTRRDPKDIILNWNRQGSMIKNVVNLRWRYDIIEIRQATPDEINDITIDRQ